MGPPGAAAAAAATEAERPPRRVRGCVRNGCEAVGRKGAETARAPHASGSGIDGRGMHAAHPRGCGWKRKFLRKMSTLSGPEALQDGGGGSPGRQLESGMRDGATNAFAAR